MKNMKPFSLSLFVSQIILKQLVEAAVELQKKCIFHRDIKTQNILIDTSSDIPRVRIIDFGLSCFVKKNSFFRIFYGKLSSFPSSLTHLSVTFTLKQNFSFGCQYSSVAKWAPHVLRLSPCCSGQGFDSTLGPLLCVPPLSLSCLSSVVAFIKAQKAKENLLPILTVSL